MEFVSMKILHSLLITSLCLALFACSSGEKIVKGNGKIVNQTRDLQDINAISAVGNVKITVYQSSAPSLLVKTDQNILPYISTETVQKQLKIYVKNKTKLVPSQDIVITINAPNIQSFQCAGMTQAKLKNLVQKSLTVDCKGNSHVNLSGQVQTFNINVSGKSSINAKKLKADEVDINADGDRKIEVHVMKSLKITGAGNSQITYYGYPEQLLENVQDQAQVKHKE